MKVRVELNLPTGVVYGSRLQLRMRQLVGRNLSNTIRERVQRRGMGAYGKLPGYSTNAISMRVNDQTRSKPIVEPRTTGRKRGKKTRRAVSAGSSSVFYKGGYRQYKEETGQVSDRFTLTNRGTLWRSWNYSIVGGSTGRVVIGFTDPKEAQIAQEAEDGKGASPARLDMLQTNQSEVEAIAIQLSELISEALAKAVGAGKRRF